MSIEFKKVNYIYGENTPFSYIALKDVSLKIPQGSFTALIGHTGSGKSTLIQHINALLLPSNGEVDIDEFVIRAGEKPEVLKPLRKKAGLVFQFPEYQLFEETIEKDIIFGPTNFGMSEEEAKERAVKVLKLVGLDESYLERSPFELSGGQKRRVAIAGILAMEPDILVLDEPTTGLDPQTRKTLWKVIDNLRKEKHMTVFLTTHYMEEAAEADQVVIIDHGRQIASGTPHELKQKYAYDYLNIYHVKEEDIKSLGHPYTYNKDHYTIRVNHPGVVKEMILQKPELFNNFELVKGRMDDVFLNVTGNKLLGGEQS